MFDMALWHVYLEEYCDNAEKAGATPVDLLELMHLAEGHILPRVKVEEIRKERHDTFRTPRGSQ